MKENGEVIGYIFEPDGEGPLAKRLESSLMVKIVRYWDGDIKYEMALYTGAEKRAILNVVIRFLKNPEVLEPKIGFEELVIEINRMTGSL